MTSQKKASIRKSKSKSKSPGRKETGRPEVASSEDGHLRYLMTAQLFDNISAAGRREVDDHLADCATCRDEFADLSSTLELVEDALEDAGPESSSGENGDSGESGDGDEQPTPYSFEERRLRRILDSSKKKSRRTAWIISFVGTAVAAGLVMFFNMQSAMYSERGIDSVGGVTGWSVAMNPDRNRASSDSTFAIDSIETAKLGEAKFGEAKLGEAEKAVALSFSAPTAQKFTRVRTKLPAEPGLVTVESRFLQVSDDDKDLSEIKLEDDLGRSADKSAVSAESPRAVTRSPAKPSAATAVRRFRKSAAEKSKAPRASRDPSGELRKLDEDFATATFEAPGRGTVAAQAAAAEAPTTDEKRKVPGSSRPSLNNNPAQSPIAAGAEGLRGGGRRGRGRPTLAGPEGTSRLANTANAKAEFERYQFAGQGQATTHHFVDLPRESVSTPPSSGPSGGGISLEARVLPGLDGVPNSFDDRTLLAGGGSASAERGGEKKSAIEQGNRRTAGRKLQEDSEVFLPPVNSPEPTSETRSEGKPNRLYLKYGEPTRRKEDDRDLNRRAASKVLQLSNPAFQDFTERDVAERGFEERVVRQEKLKEQQELVARSANLADDTPEFGFASGAPTGEPNRGLDAANKSERDKVFFKAYAPKKMLVDGTVDSWVRLNEKQPTDGLQIGGVTRNGGEADAGIITWHSNTSNEALVKDRLDRNGDGKAGAREQVLSRRQLEDLATADAEMPALATDFDRDGVTDSRQQIGGRSDLGLEFFDQLKNKNVYFGKAGDPTRAFWGTVSPDLQHHWNFNTAVTQGRPESPPVTTFSETLADDGGNSHGGEAGRQRDLRRMSHLGDRMLLMPWSQRTLRSEIPLRSYYYWKKQNQQLTLPEFLSRPMPIAPPAVGDEGLGQEGFRKKYKVHPFVATRQDALSTFGLDVDTATYALARNHLRAGRLPPAAAIRVEEFINSFPEDVEVDPDSVFSVFSEGGPSPFGRGLDLLKITIKTRELRPNERKDAVLTFAVDTSGSMALDGRLELVRGSLRKLVESLAPGDRVAIVAFGANAFVVLPHTSIRDRSRVLAAIDSLRPTGGTNVESGLDLAYRLADESMQPRAVNRVVLCSDGVANVGSRGPDEILRKVRVYAARGIYLSTVGFGMRGYRDSLLQKLSDQGDGNYAYVDTLDEASRIFTQNLPSTLQVLAKDAKIQVHFDPKVVTRYRLLGYEKRDIADKDFRNDSVDAGEVGPGTTVTVLYELQRRTTAPGNIGRVFLRYRDTGTRRIEETNYDIAPGVLATRLNETSDRFRFIAAIAELAEILRESYFARDGSLSSVLMLLSSHSEEFKSQPEWQEVAELVQRALKLSVQKLSHSGL